MAESFANTFGCMFVAFLIDAVLYGAAMLMVFQYFWNFGRKDALKLRILVGIMGVITTVQVTTFFAWAHTDLITRFGRFDLLDSMPRTAQVQLLAIYLAAFISQIFFATRIWILSKGSIVMTTPIVLLSMLQISAGIAQTTLVAIGGTFSNLIKTEKVTSTQSASTAACDVLITFVLCFLLQRNRTGVKSTDTMLDRLMLYAINRGAITSIAATLNFSLFIWRPEAMIFMIPLLCSSQLYVLSIVATLNHRHSLRNDMNSSDNMNSLPLATRTIGGTLHGGVSKNPSHHGGVHVKTSVVTWDNDNGDHSSDVEAGEGRNQKSESV